MIARPPVWVCRLVKRFWAEIPEPSAFPRHLRSDVACWFTELHVQDVPGLTLSRATEKFRRAGIPVPDPTEDRPLCGCFGSFHDLSYILIDPDDDPAELRFTFAHELAHYLRDCRYKRQDAGVRFGPDILAVLDGDRPATFSERLAGALRAVTIGAHMHFLERDHWGRTTDEATREAEAAADRLAFELLAPFDAVGTTTCHSRAALVERLTSVFGLPDAPAAKYAAALVR